MRSLDFPFDSNEILLKKHEIKELLLKEQDNFICKNIAILGGSTVHDIKECLEIFLMSQGIKTNFYESVYGMYWEEAVFNSDKLKDFKPDIIYIHTSNRNISKFPQITDNKDDINLLINSEYSRFEIMWEKLKENYSCPIIQNNFEMLPYRIMGNKDVSDVHGRFYYINSINNKFYEYAQKNNNFYINDINYLSANFGLNKWHDEFAWYIYKYCCSLDAIPYLAFNISNIIKSLFGKNKKALAIDLDNTLWGGIIGEDGIEGIALGKDNPMGQAYSEFQEYVKELKNLGVLLNVVSKNNYDDAIEGLNHSDMVLKPEDFMVIKANWENKAANIIDIAKKINILPESIVFLDDNPTERELVKSSIKNISVPEFEEVEMYRKILGNSGFFEITTFSDEDIKRNEMYKQNLSRMNYENDFADYNEYLKALDMNLTIMKFKNEYISRITQLINKSNQFNLTTKRLTEKEVLNLSSDNKYTCLCAKLNDKFGDYGIITNVIGRTENNIMYIDLWLMSCRVLKKNVEEAMLDRLIWVAKEKNIEKIVGVYLKTSKNMMVEDFYEKMGFSLIEKNENGDSYWELFVDDYVIKNNVINVVVE